MHRNPEIADVSYFGIRRELFNRELTGYKFMQNTGIDLRFNFSRNNSNLVQSDLFVEKRWPRKEGIFIFGIGLKQTDAKYSGSLADTNSETRLILRPSFKFWAVYLSKVTLCFAYTAGFDFNLLLTLLITR